jgi:Fe-S-cluster containining protein
MRLVSSVNYRSICEEGDEMVEERTEFGFTRIVCACSACARFCIALPGYLVPSNIQRIAERLNEPDIVQFSFDNLLASPGAIVIANGAYRTIPTLVPARKPDASCRFLKNGRCEIHAEAPYGCAYFSAEQTKEEADAISARGLQEIAKAWRSDDLYAQLWLMLYHAGRIAPSPIEARASMRAALAAEECAGEGRSAGEPQ